MRAKLFLLRAAAVVLPLVSLGSLLVTHSSVAQTCNHDCPVGARDAHGCCPATVTIHAVPTLTATARPPVTVATNTVTCPSGYVRIPGATYMMGAPDTEGDPDEHPQHAVTVATFCMARLEVTVAQYQSCVTAGMCIATKNESQCNGTHTDTMGTHPINCISFPRALAYCNWAGGRLPTEEEWEYASRGTDGRRYPWGNAAPSAQLLNACGDECVAQAAASDAKVALYSGNDGWVGTAPVGSYPRGASPFGLLDMAGNVYEWTSSPYCTYPVHNCTSNYRMYRGGGFYSSGPAAGTTKYIGAVTSSTRNGNNATEESSVVGIRCAK
jgi:formylglycine-generating enzyme required for sulfatase activity